MSQFLSPVLLPADPAQALEAATKQYVDSVYITLGTTTINARTTVLSLAGLTSIAASTFTGALVGNASTATKLGTARNIGLTGVTATPTGFDGSVDINIPITSVPTSLLTGTLAAGQFPALTGDITTVAGSLAATIANASVTLAKLADLSGGSLIGNSGVASAPPTAITIGSGLSLVSGVLSATGGGGSPPFSLTNGETLATWAAGAWINTGPGGVTATIGTSGAGNLLSLGAGTPASAVQQWYCDASGNTFQLGNIAAVAGTFTGDVTTTGNFTATGVIHGGNGNGTISFQIGNDSALWDVNVANTCGVMGVEDPTKGFIRFGNSTNGFGWDGTNLLFGASIVHTDATANINAATLGGAAASDVAGNSTIVKRTVNGYIFSNYINTTANVETAVPSYVAMQTGDNFVRWQTPAQFKINMKLCTDGTLIENRFANTVFQNTSLRSGIFSNQGDGLLNAAGTATALPGWWHVISNYHDTNGYGSQIATELSAYATNGMWIRSSSGATWKEWSQVALLDRAVNFSGSVSANRVYTGYDSGVTSSVSSSDWFRTSGAGGFYCATYGGGIYMTDTTYVRAYNGKSMAAADFVITSDKNAKHKIRPFEYKGRLTPRHFTLNEKNKLSFGFIAQEVRKLYPEAVSNEKNEKYLSLSYNLLTAVLSHQVNTLEDEFAVVKEDMETMRSEVTTLRSDMDTLRETVRMLSARLH